MSAVLVMLLLIIALGLIARHADRRTVAVMVLAIVAYLAYAYISG
jgi:hypothetical protein